MGLQNLIKRRCLSQRRFSLNIGIYVAWVSIVLMIQGCSSGGSNTASSVLKSSSSGSISSTSSSSSSDDGNVKSVARRWNEILLEAIRNDLARPTVHARNLFHLSAAMYDAWSSFSDISTPYLLGKQYGSVNCTWDDSLFTQASSGDLDWRQSESERAISYAAFRLIQSRFSTSPGATKTLAEANQLMDRLGFDTTLASTDLTTGNSAALGNFIAQCYIGFGLQDGSNEAAGYSNLIYEPVNAPLAPQLPGNPDITNLNRWQPLALATFIDQAGNPIVGGALAFLGPEWGNVQPFALTDNELTIHRRDNVQYKVYYDPGLPPQLGGQYSEVYQWGFSLVSRWSAQLDPSDNVIWDISPASIGNVGTLPTHFEDYVNFYQAEGGDTSQGRPLNPVTGLPYAPQYVRRGDYARVLAEFWADGPNSETPPGHWFVILNSVMDHPLFSRRFGGNGEQLSPLEWDIKAYFALGGAMHDSAITAWSIKGWYDYIRPVSAIRAMADLGQSTDINAANWHPNGIPLAPGLVELVKAGDPLAGYENQFVGKIKVLAWQGPEYVVNPENDTGDVGWILAENWWPYQRPSFVTPPFAGYVSGHSTYSRAAAEVLTLLTGNDYFPGGKSSFEVKKNEFLVFEEGPSEDMTLEWATYRDASDQCSLSRIWGGIHPPQDDIPGRIIGEQIGKKAFAQAQNYFNDFQ